MSFKHVYAELVLWWGTTVEASVTNCFAFATLAALVNRQTLPFASLAGQSSALVSLVHICKSGWGALEGLRTQLRALREVKVKAKHQPCVAGG